jgi:membrane protease YdiL (CAAX protease family)
MSAKPVGDTVVANEGGTPMNSKHRKGVVAYLAITFGLAWAVWAIVLLGLGVSAGPALVPGMFAPAVAAGVVRRWITREGFADTGLIPRPDRAPRAYLGALLFGPAMTVLVVALAVVVGTAVPQFHFRSGPAGPLLALGIAVVFTPVLWGEEFGWRGYLQPRLFPGRPLASAVGTGLAWAAWHYPVILLTGFNYPGHRALGLVLFTVSAVLTSIVLGWFQRRAGSSWAPSLAHSGLNYFAEPVLGALFPGVSSVIAGVGGVLAIPAVAVIAIWLGLTGRLPARSKRPAVAVPGRP